MFGESSRLVATSEPGLRRRSRSVGTFSTPLNLRAAVQICEGIRAGSSFEKRQRAVLSGKHCIKVDWEKERAGTEETSPARTPTNKGGQT
jgi:hypothetical protein